MKGSAEGVIDPRLIYTTAALASRGISRMTLSEFRKETGSEPVKIGSNHWYRGEDVINWMMSKRERQ